jgi:hypothetical protein
MARLGATALRITSQLDLVLVGIGPQAVHIKGEWPIDVGHIEDDAIEGDTLNVNKRRFHVP